ncbi:threonine dehydratase catabolic [Moelleriella libera RCEF 2490]|uniref:Threonine dehydratase catabolic n=1 Tax=Moelleriella libera RCEF 2490 TaxID=1081109 RepID=A0A167WQE7_9HYPO|nr:threonine dehydratase catabolic [Moelleriella libera RCEF 2490]
MAEISSTPPLTRRSVADAHALIRPHIHATPVVTSRALSELASTPRSRNNNDGDGAARPRLRLWFKCENLQRVGAFKVRGAFHALERLKREPGWAEGGGRERGVVTHSSESPLTPPTGNHAQALALAARENNIPAHIVMPTVSMPAKIAATKGYGARVYLSGSTSAEREALAAQVMTDTGGARLIPPYDHPDIILGQGTVGLELQEQAAQLMATTDPYGTASSYSSSSSSSSSPLASPPRLDAIMTPCGGGGMLSGADDAKRGFERGQRVTSVSSATIADGLRTPLGEWPWRIIYERRLVSGMYSVTDDDIRAALRLVWERMKLVVEPSAVVGLAVALYNEDFRAMVEREAGERGWDLGLVLSGGNIGLDAVPGMLL